MFEEARRRYLESLGGSSNSPFGVHGINNFESIYQEIGNLARKQATEYLRTTETTDTGTPRCCCSEIEFEKIVETYKLLIVPDNTLQCLLQAMGRDAARKEFRRVAMLIHPDKNSHPSAKIAFQKLYHHFKGVLADTE